MWQKCRAQMIAMKVWKVLRLSLAAVLFIIAVLAVVIGIEQRLLLNDLEGAIRQSAWYDMMGLYFFGLVVMLLSFVVLISRHSSEL